MSKIQSRVEDGSILNMYYDEHTDELTVERWQDAEPLLERNKALHAQLWDGYNADRSMKAIAEIPMAFAEQWLREGVNVGDPNCDGEVLKRLRDPALAGFRLGDTRTPSGIIIKGDR